MKRKAILTLVFVAALLCTSIALGQETPFDPNRTVVPISKLNIGSVNFGTGFCLNPNCSFIGTNYHVAVRTGSALKIRGEKVTERYLGSGPDDEGATLNEVMDSVIPSMKYNLTRDFAIFGLKRPLAHKGLRGVTFTLDDLEENQEVDIYAYPLSNQLMVKRRLTKFPGKFAGETQNGLL